MIKLASSICLLLVAVAPASAQEAAPRLDWTKPQIFDAPPTDRNQPVIREDAPLPVEVYTIEDLKAVGSPSLEDFSRSIQQSQPAGADSAGQAQKENADPADPLASYSPEMREKLRRYLPNDKQRQSQ